jgi:transcriptional regulator with XRE-family HTH domain
MLSVPAAEEELARLGARLREARLARDDSMHVFAQRLGVSVPTLRAMEQGASSVQVGYWANALWTLDRLHDLSAVLPQSSSPLDQVRERRLAKRQRASRRSA